MIGIQEALYKATEDNRKLEKKIKELEVQIKNQKEELRKQSEVIIPKNIEQHNEIVDLNVRIKELEIELRKYKKAYNKLIDNHSKYIKRIDKAIEYIGNGNIGIPRKTREKFIKILKGE